jgi:sugar O-acyltransferase (sialic acid O-acetyltransferase NeuD family)
LRSDIIIFGAGGSGRETAQLIDDINKECDTWNILGFIDDDEDITGKEYNKYKVLGNTEYLIKNIKRATSVAIAINNPNIKKRIVKKLILEGFDFPVLIHPSVYLADNISIGKGVIIQANTTVSTNVQIADFVHINHQCGIGHDAEIGSYSSLYWNINLSGFSKISDGCILGTKTTVLQNITVGRGSITGSNTNVIRDIPENSVVVGNPANVIKDITV